MPSRRVPLVALSGNICAAPLYWVQLLNFLGSATTNLFLVASGATAILIGIVTYAWWRDRTIGAVVQLVALIPTMIMTFVTERAASSVPSRIDVADLRFVSGLLLGVGVPCLLLALSLVILWRDWRAKSRTDVGADPNSNTTA